MNITDIRLRRINKDGKMRAIVSITIDGEFVIHDIRVIEGSNGFFVAMPSRRSNDGEFRDIAHPISQECRNRLQELILEKYKESLDEESDPEMAFAFTTGAE